MNRTLTPDEIKQAVREGYTKLLDASSCCASTGSTTPVPITLERKRTELASVVGYAAEELRMLPDGAVVSAFGCGNPLSFAELKAGQVVLDIGSGAGIDCLLASEKVGPTGRVIGLDMTPAMTARARENARAAGATNVEFRLGDAEQMPVEDESVDWVISNCVINLAPDKRRVFSEVVRVLVPGGRVSISDIVLGDDLPDEIVQSVDALVGCVAGAIKESEYLQAMRDAGLIDVAVTARMVYTEEQLAGFLASMNHSDNSDAQLLWNRYRDRLIGNVWSARISARKPRHDEN
ncbi:MAG: arsenite methyltransferase [Acidobacteriota bacterium]|nr:arsenite methyltransferase [Blastocatellia bacterium]MDW8238962.1 arsenite methyltransferase [Acidobacteriota bacterium]